jgi:solute carrier family 45 protein 1/2/4
MPPRSGLCVGRQLDITIRSSEAVQLGSLVCAFSMLLFGFTRAVASVSTGWDNDSVRVTSLLSSSQFTILQNNALTMWLAVLSIYLIDFSINVGQ